MTGAGQFIIVTVTLLRQARSVYRGAGRSISHARSVYYRFGGCSLPVGGKPPSPAQSPAI
jgi:hypothetical protein